MKKKLYIAPESDLVASIPKEGFLMPEVYYNDKTTVSDEAANGSGIWDDNNSSIWDRDDDTD